MQKINHYFKNVRHTFTTIKLSTPLAIIVGSVIISGGIMGYGAIISGGTATGTQTVANPLPKMLKAIGVDKKAFAACVDNGTMAASVSASTQDGTTAGVTGTPTSFVIKEEGGIQYVVATVSGAQTYDFFKSAIDQALSTATVKNLPKFTGKAVDPSEVAGPVAASKVYVVEYSDLECPFCISLYGTMKKVRTDYDSKISFVYRNFPLTQIHQHAQKEAEMVSCATTLGGAEAYHALIDSMFEFKIKNNIGYIPVDSK